MPNVTADYGRFSDLIAFLMNCHILQITTCFKVKRYNIIKLLQTVCEGSLVSTLAHFYADALVSLLMYHCLYLKF